MASNKRSSIGRIGVSPEDILIRRIVMALPLALCAVGTGSSAAERVYLELVLLADASRSIDDDEIRCQRRNYAAAITHPQILAAISHGYRQRIAVTYVEWGGENSQKVVVPWTIIGFSGDSANSFGGIPITDARAAALADNIVINGLAILCADCSSGRPIFYYLEAAFAQHIIGGRGSFVVTADGPRRFRPGGAPKTFARDRWHAGWAHARTSENEGSPSNCG